MILLKLLISSNSFKLKFKIVETIPQHFEPGNYPMPLLIKNYYLKKLEFYDILIFLTILTEHLLSFGHHSKFVFYVNEFNLYNNPMRSHCCHPYYQMRKLKLKRSGLWSRSQLVVEPGLELRQLRSDSKVCSLYTCYIAPPPEPTHGISLTQLFPSY